MTVWTGLLAAHWALPASDTVLPGSLHNALGPVALPAPRAQMGRSRHRTSASQGPDDRLLDSLWYQSRLLKSGCLQLTPGVLTQLVWEAWEGLKPPS